MRLIDADALMEKLLDQLKDGEVLYRIPPQAIDDAPTIEAEPVKHGRWIVTSEYNEIIEMEVTKWTCSVCNEINPNAFKTNYCPNCGAKMEGGADHERL